MDGCPADTTGLSGQWLGSDRYGISALKESAICILNENTSLTLLSDRSEDTDSSLTYLIEATERTSGIINGMIRMRLVDEWTCTESKGWKDGMVRVTYGRKTPRQPVVMFKK